MKYKLILEKNEYALIQRGEKLKEYATIPSRDGLLTMLAGGMIGLVRDLSICLNLYGEQKEESEK